MPTTDSLTMHSSHFLDGVGICYLDLAYAEYVDRDEHGAATAHVEQYFAMLARVEQGLPEVV